MRASRLAAWGRKLRTVLRNPANSFSFSSVHILAAVWTSSRSESTSWGRGMSERERLRSLYALKKCRRVSQQSSLLRCV
jgi:hypothetical protein